MAKCRASGGHRPRACPGCGAPVSRIPDVGNPWLDAGIVPFSTLGWQNEEWVEGGFGTGAAKGLTGLTSNALQGIRRMPAHGGNANLTDTEIERAITYMVNQSGGNWIEPTSRTGVSSSATQPPTVLPDIYRTQPPAPRKASACRRAVRSTDNRCQRSATCTAVGAPSRAPSA